jgi:hypothetical protein
MTTVSTHTGICQACGRRQAVHVNSGLIAKHGYTTEYGYFNGTCDGSDKLPLELDTKVNVAIVASIYKWAAEQEAKADSEILKVAVQVGKARYVGQRRVVDTKLVDRAEFEATQPSYASFDREVESIRYSLRRQAEIARANAAELDDLRDKVHGQPLQPRAVEAPIKREYFKAIREAYARQAELKEQGVEARIRRGTYVGQPHTLTYR